MSSDDEHFALETSHNTQYTSNIPSSLPPTAPETAERLDSAACPDLNGAPTTPKRSPQVTRPISTPVMFTVNGSSNLFENMIAEDKYPEMAKEVKKWAVGPMPEQPFLDHFLPYNTNIGPEPVINTSSTSHALEASDSVQEAPKMPSAFDSIKFPVKTEQELYDPIVSAWK